MPLNGIDHVNIVASDLAKTEAFYTALGFTVAPRPAISMRGLWLALGGHAFVHVMARAEGQSPVTTDGATVDHVAFAASNPDDMRTLLTKAGIPFRESKRPEFGIQQIFVTDPDGVRVELNFKTARAAPQAKPERAEAL